jgi:hypothetical protein
MLCRAQHSLFSLLLFLLLGFALFRRECRFFLVVFTVLYYLFSHVQLLYVSPIKNFTVEDQHNTLCKFLQSQSFLAKNLPFRS